MSFIAVDWGTSSRRGALLDDDGHVLEVRRDTLGIRAVPAGGFAAAFEAFVGDWMAAPARRALVSGMAGSRQGWIEAPYVACPADTARLARDVVPVGDGRVRIVPGVAVDDPDDVPDVMRGEEVQILGAMALSGRRDGLVVLPGTHSKCARVAEGRIVAFRTCMTGELYALLARQSILAHTIDADAPLDEAAFLEGVARARHGDGLLHDVFGARTLGLFRRRTPAALASYLSGLLIGEELRIRPTVAPGEPVTLVGTDELTQRYALALQASGQASHILGDEATWAGLLQIHRLRPD